MTEATKTVLAYFETREAADIAVEHLVQQYGLERPDIFVQAEGGDNTSGTSSSGGDSFHDGSDRQDGSLTGEILVSVDIDGNKLQAVQRVMGDAGALRVSTK